jgi:ankyrin repeat protein
MYLFTLIKKSIVFIGFFAFSIFSQAGSYEDYFKAVAMDDVPSVRALLQRGFDPNTVNPSGVSGLMLAVRESSLKVAELLVGWSKTNLDKRNDQDESVLMLAALKGYLPLVKKLIDHDADVNKPGWTPLHYAATSGHVPVIELLLDSSAYIDAESPNGSTPLMMAAMYGSPEAVKVLIQAGADLTAKNQLGLSALDFAVQGRRQNSQALIETGLQRLANRVPSTESASSVLLASDPTVPAPVRVVSPDPLRTERSETQPKPFKTGW